jgi:hypothetical protein
MTLEQALDIVIEREGVERYRYLCLDHPNPSVRAEYSRLIMQLAGQPPRPGPTAKEAIELGRRILGCPYRSIGQTACGCGVCALRGGESVSRDECIDCLTRYPDPKG